MFSRYLTFVALLALLLTARHASAHANLLRSDPPANASLTAAPAEIRLTFSEPLEAQGSRISLRDQNGEEVATPPSVIDADDPYTMTLTPPALPDGLYTVAWRALSAADGHATQGSLAFGINVAVSAPPLPTVDESIAPLSVAIRWLNVLALALIMGGATFGVFVAASMGTRHAESVQTVGWVLMGVALTLLLVMQTANTAGISFGETITSPALPALLTGSRYGALWWVRVACWLLMLLALRAGERGSVALLVLGGISALAHSLFSHAAAAPDPTAIALNWLHLTMPALWIGSLVEFVVTLFRLRREGDTTQIAELTARYSQMARVLVLALAVAGVYAAWLHVGWLEALWATVYGRALVVKSVLFLPLLALAAVNLLVTGRRIAAGSSMWTRWLRRSVLLEIALGISIFAATSVMTSGAPARDIHAQQVAYAEAAAAEQPNNAYFGMQVVNDQMVHLDIYPGYIGINTFTVTPYDAEGSPITDATLIRLRFTALDDNLGNSELRPEHVGDGVYTVEGANLSQPGRWRIRMTVQQPNQFDQVVDFETTVTLPPSAPPPPIIDTTIPLEQRQVALALAGGALVVIGAVVMWRTGGIDKKRTGHAPSLQLLGLTVLIVGGVALAGIAFASGSLSVRDAWMLDVPMGSTGGVYLTLVNDSSNDAQLMSASVAPNVAEAVELHQTQQDGTIARMREVETLAVAARTSLTIAPGGYHIMLVNLMQEFDVGDVFPLKLTFASGETQIIDVTVRDTPLR
jgi:copper transport protein